MQATCAENLRREIELTFPIDNRLTAEEAFGPLVHLPGDILGDLHEDRATVNRVLEVALVVERHRRDLAERVLAVEHPAVGAGEQRVRGVPQAPLEIRLRTRGRPGALNPLPFEIGGDVAADEVPGARVGDFEGRSRDRGVGIEKADALAALGPIAPALIPRRHHGLAIAVERRQHTQCLNDLWREDVSVLFKNPAANLERDSASSSNSTVRHGHSVIASD